MLVGLDDQLIFSNFQDSTPWYLVKDSVSRRQELLCGGGGGGRGQVEGEDQHQGVVQAVQTHSGPDCGLRLRLSYINVSQDKI